MTYAVKINEEIKILSPLPNTFNGKAGIKNLNQEQLLQLGIKPIITPVLDQGKQLGTLIESEGGLTFTYTVIDAIPPTAQELYNNLKSEGKIVFDEYRRILSEASIQQLIKGNVDPNLVTLVETLEATKERINNALDYYLANNDIENLQAFTYQTEEAQQLKEAIEQFKL